MIGFNDLGKLGRLGNQMFQFASLKGIAKNCKFEYCIPPSKNKNEWEDHQLFNSFKLSNTSELNIQFIDIDRPTLIESDLSFSADLFNKCPDWVSLQGFFQTEKYFKHIEREIKEDFQFKDEIFESCKESISQLNNPISLHIRRTDYITNPNHSVLNLDYYESALNKVNKNSSILVISDDPDWCSQQKLFKNDRFLISEQNSNYIDLCLMTLCSEHIIANSSFSWWGAWLADSRNVIAPSNWFTGSKNEHLDTKDLIPKNWIII